MDKLIKEKLMRIAMREAGKAAEDGNYPFGAVAADSEGETIISRHNTQNTDNDPTAHAEINLIRALAKTHDETDFGKIILVSNAESCSMCFSAAIKAGVRHFVFGVPSESHMEPYLTVADVMRFTRVDLDVSFGVLEDECRAQIKKIREDQGRLAQ